MPGVTAPPQDKPIKMLFMGDSSQGKTGALASLAAAGYNLRIIDFDNGCEIFHDLFLGKAAKYPAEAANRIRYVTCRDPMEILAGKIIPKQSVAWPKAIGLMNNWIDGEDRFGPVTKWTSRDILVLDSSSHAGRAALVYHHAMNNKLGKIITANEARRDIYIVQEQLLEPLFATLYDPAVKCHVIVIAHITYIADQEAKATGVDNPDDLQKLSKHGYPSAIGQALSIKIPQYFNHILECRTVGEGPGAMRRIYTKTQGRVALKTPAPFTARAEYPLASGLADYFADLRGPLPKEVPSITPSAPPAPPAIVKAG